MLASPGFTAGNGTGSAASASVRPIASAASRAMRRSASLTGNSNNRVCHRRWCGRGFRG